MSNKLLNLDELSSDTKVIKLDNLSHVMKILTVQEFIDKTAEVQKMKAEVEDTNLPLDKQVMKVIEMITEAFPSLKPERLNVLPFPHLMAIVDFAFKAPEEIEAEVLKEQNKGN